MKTNVAASVRQRLLNEAKRRGESFDYVASLYARERFLARLAASRHRDHLILKSPTRDLDFLGRGNVDDAAALIREIGETNVADDGLEFDASSLTAEPIREPNEYRGVRLHVTAFLDTARIRLQIDIAVGDVVTPPARVAALPSILHDFPTPRVKVYPPETIVAEKLHAMVKLGIANTRMKDFFDVYLLARSRDFDRALLAKAIARTFARRKTALPEEPFALTGEFYADRGKQAQWRAFLTKSGVDAPAEFPEIGRVLRNFLRPVMSARKQ